MRNFLITVTALAFLAACGAEPDTESELAADLPLCSEVWIEGADLPEDYEGCMDADGRVAEDRVTRCVDGNRLIRHEELHVRWFPRFVEIVAIQDEHAYGEDLGHCRDAEY